MIKAVIFDLNGVFLKSKPLSDRLAKKTGKSSEEIFEVMKPILNEVRKPSRRGAEIWGPLLGFAGMNQQDFFDFYFRGEKIDREMLAFAKELKANGLKILILSNNFQERTEYYRKYFPELFEMANRVYFSWETGFVKPDIQAYRNLLSENGLDGEECIYVDDSKENLEAAKSLGIQVVQYVSKEQVMEEIEKLI